MKRVVHPKYERQAPLGAVERPTLPGDPPQCTTKLECGGECKFVDPHEGDCMCIGDFDDEPGSCQA